MRITILTLLLSLSLPVLAERTGTHWTVKVEATDADGKPAKGKVTMHGEWHEDGAKKTKDSSGTVDSPWTMTSEGTYEKMLVIARPVAEGGNVKVTLIEGDDKGTVVATGESDKSAAVTGKQGDKNKKK
jgi:hypothetical protein